ncbi:MAG: nucleotidyltransferase family protein [Planctomycetes bacterium]|nr:nucleotidyltransferase family protein [Planctomycetota bacterium]
MFDDVTAVILAAGDSRRMGTAKSLLKFNEKTALELLVISLRDAGIQQILAVCGTDDRVADEARRLSIHGVYNLDPGSGRTRSLQLALPVIDEDHSILLCPVDAPLVASTTMKQLLQNRAPGKIVRACYQKRGGHPVLFDSTIRGEILSLAADQSLRDVVHRDATRVLDIETDDEEVLTNLNTPEDYKNSVERFRINQ